jgi:glycerate kinase
MKVLIAPNAFKGTLTAPAAAAALARGARRALPGAEVRTLPMADGGDGLLDALRSDLGGRLERCLVEGPLGRPVKARWLLAGKTAFVEMAEAAGLRLLGNSGLRPLDASTYGVGQLIAAAAARGAREIAVGLGGSASNDGGAGCAEALGFKLLDAQGRPVPRGARGLAALREIVAPRRALPGIRVVGLADVKNKLCGRLGSARVFGPQKGAGPAEVEFMEAALLNYARVLKRCLGADIARLPGGAAAGGLGAGLAAFFGAELRDGSAFVLGRIGFARALAGADLLITGEGRFDEQTFYGKAPGAAIAAARAAGIPALVVCGSSAFRNSRRPRGVIAIIEAPGKTAPAASLEKAVMGALMNELVRIKPASRKHA